MSGLDEISVQIGSIQAQLGEAARQRDAQFRKIDALADKQVEALGFIREQMNALKALEVKHDLLSVRIREIEPHVASFREIKTRGLTILAVLAAIGSAAGVSASQVWKAITGGP